METGVQTQTGDRLIRVLAFTMAISVMSSLMFNIVLPEIRAEYHLSLALASWVTTAYLLVFAIGTVVYGKLADTCKLKDLLTFGLVFFALGSMVGLLSQDFWMVLLGRILQAAGAAVIPAAAGIIPIRYFPPEKRGRALGISMAGGAIGIALGPVITALLVSMVHWRWLFCVPIFTLFTLPYYRRYLTGEHGGKGKTDWLGGGLLAGTVASLLLAITKQAWTPAAVCLVLFVLFVLRIRSVPEPFVKPDLFKSKGYCLGLAMAFLATGIGYSLPFLSPQLLTHVNHLPARMVGFAMVPAAVITAVLGRKGGRMADAKGNPFLYYTASALLLTCFVLLSCFAGTSPAFISLFLIFGQVGQTFISIALSNSISRTLPEEHSGVGMGLLSMLNFMAGAVFAAVYSAMVDKGATANWNPVNSHMDAFVYSNIYLVLAILHASMLLFYCFRIGRTAPKKESA